MSLSEPATSTRPAAGPSGNLPDQRATSSAFDSALRGYERRQVDEYVARQRNETATLRAQLAEARAAAQAGHRARRGHRGGEPAAALHRRAARRRRPEEGFGFRAEKLLRLAEQEAAEVRARTPAGVGRRCSSRPAPRPRSTATRSSSSSSRGLRSSTRQAARRAVELQEREQQISDQLEATRAETEQLHAAATRAADRLRQESEAKAEEIRIRAEAAAKKVRDEAEHDLMRLSALRSNVHAELARLAEVLVNELPVG